MSKLKTLFLNKKGFSLVELMVAVAILMAVVIGIFYGFTNAFQAMADSKHRTVATNLAQQKLEEVKNSAGLLYPYYSTKYYTEKLVETTNQSDKFYTVVVATNSVETNLEEVNATVSWHDRNGVQKDVRLTTLVYDLKTFADLPPNIGKVLLSADPQEGLICCREDQVSIITAEVFDEDGERFVPSGTPIIFTVDEHGSLSNDFALTDTTGRATTELTIKESHPARVSVSLGSAIVPIEPPDLEVKCNTVPSEILLSANPSTVFPNEVSEITATVKDSCGQVFTPSEDVPEVVVTFTTNHGYFDNSPGTVEKEITVDNSGKATVDLYLTEGGEIAEVIGEVEPDGDDPFSDSVEVICSEYRIMVSTQFDTISPAGGNPDETEITAFLTDMNNSPVEGKVISFTKSPGAGTLDVISAITDSEGKATAVLSNLNGGETVTVTASYENQVSDQVSVKCEQFIMSIAASPEAIIPTGSSDITVTLLDYLGNPAENYRISFFTSKGLLNNSDVYTDSNGKARTRLSGLSQGEEAVVSATFGSLNKSTTVECVNYTITIDASPSVIKDKGGQKVTITATLTKYNGYMTKDELRSIVFTATAGNLSSPATVSAWYGYRYGTAEVTLRNLTAGDYSEVTAKFTIPDSGGKKISASTVVSCLDIIRPPIIPIYTNNDKTVEVDLELIGGPYELEAVKLHWTNPFPPYRFLTIWIGEKVGNDFNYTRVFNYTGNLSNWNSNRALTENNPYVITENTKFKMRIEFDNIIKSRTVTVTFNPRYSGAKHPDIDFTIP